MSRRNLQIALLAVAGLALVVWVVAVFGDPRHASRGYLIGWLFWLAAALGSAMWVMLHNLTGGKWGDVVRRPAIAVASTMPLVAISFVPMLFALRHLFPWVDPAMADEPLVRHRAPLMNVPFFAARSVAFLVIWSLFAWGIRSRSGRGFSAAGLVILFATVSLAGMDWIASREIDWYSSAFGVVTVLGQAATAIALLVVLVAARGTAVDPSTLIDLGNLLQTSVVLWAYVSFMQFLVIYSGNALEDITWYVHRTTHGWQWAARAVIGLHFAVPFAALLFRSVKRRIGALAGVAGLVLAMRLLDVVWMIVPSNHGPAPAGLHWLDGVGAILFVAVAGLAIEWRSRKEAARDLA